VVAVVDLVEGMATTMDMKMGGGATLEMVLGSMIDLQEIEEMGQEGRTEDVAKIGIDRVPLA
jgi:hypothetical protein